MALNIVRHDITKIKADAIVNSTNEHLRPGGLGVDASIHYAAGPKLKEALDKIGTCPVTSAVVTEAFNIPSCRYIIHAVAPVYVDGSPKEKALLRRTYTNILDLAAKNQYRSVAIPLLSAGANAYPKEEAYALATGAIRGWLADHDASELKILLVLFAADVVDLGKAVDPSLRDYITDYYTHAHREELREYYRKPRFGRNAPGAVPEESCAAQAPSCAPDEAEESYADLDLSFAEMCEWWCGKKGLKKGEFFSASNITRATFSNIKLHPDRAPKKNTVLACAVGLKLDIDQATDLLMRAGMTFSPHYPTDCLVESCIRGGRYNIDDINLMLFERDLTVLGYSRGA